MRESADQLSLLTARRGSKLHTKEEGLLLGGPINFRYGTFPENKKFRFAFSKFRETDWLER
jgi:hypothetical protein